MPAWFVPMMAAAAGSKSKGGGGGQTDEIMKGPLSKGLGDVGGLVSGIYNFKNAKKRDADAREYAAQQRTQNLFNYDRAMDGYENQLDLAPKLAGTNSADYDSSTFRVPTGADEVGGGALRTQLEMSQGYNPTMAYNPYLNVFGADKTAVSALRHDAQNSAANTLSDWEASQANVASGLDDSLERIRGDRDALVADYTAAVEESGAEREADTARMIIDTWINSTDSAGAMGGPGRGDDFVNRRGINGRRIQGASSPKKRDYIEERLASGDSYADILNDRDFVDLYLSQDKSAAPVFFSRWDVEEDESTSHETNPEWNIL